MRGQSQPVLLPMVEYRNLRINLDSAVEGFKKSEESLTFPEDICTVDMSIHDSPCAVSGPPGADGMVCPSGGPRSCLSCLWEEMSLGGALPPWSQICSVAVGMSGPPPCFGC